MEPQAFARGLLAAGTIDESFAEEVQSNDLIEITVSEHLTTCSICKRPSDVPFEETHVVVYRVGDQYLRLPRIFPRGVVETINAKVLSQKTMSLRIQFQPVSSYIREEDSLETS